MKPSVFSPANSYRSPYHIVHYEYIASAKMTPVLREAMLFIFEPRRVGAFEPPRVCGDFLKP